MVQPNDNKSPKKVDCFKQIFGAASCTGDCIYKWDPVGNQYVLQPGSSCTGGASCSSCSHTQPAVLFGLVLLLGSSCFADPQVITLNCGVDIESVVATAVRAIKFHKLLVRLVIGLGVVSALSIAGATYFYFAR